MPTAREMREFLAANKATWTVSERLADDAEPPHCATGATTEGLLPAAEAARINFPEVLAALPGNSLLLAHGVARGFVPSKAVEEMGLEWALALEEAPLLAAAPASLDWRERWGWRWITGKSGS